MKKQNIFNRLAVTLLAVRVMLGSISLSAFALESGADGQIIISTAEELLSLAEAVNDGENADAHVLLTDDISVEDSWTPLGKNAMAPFKGVFDGNGHSVTVTVDNPRLSYFGFFGCLENATVKNLTVNGEIYCSEPYAYVGGLSARARGNVTVENCVNNAVVSSYARGSAGVGGIIGGYDDGVEYVFENIRLVLNGCVNNGMIMVTGADSKAVAGGILGSNANCAQLTECENNGAIYAPEICIGGLMGQAGYTTGDFHTSITDCRSEGAITGKSGKTFRLYGSGNISSENINGSGDNEGVSDNDITLSLITESQKYSSSAFVPEDSAVGDYVNLIRSGEAADESITVVCSQGEKDIKKGFLECDENGIKLIKLNDTGKIVTETATLSFTDETGSTLRKPISVSIAPGEKGARTALMHNIAATYAENSEEWVVFDMAVYETLGFGENTTDKTAYLNKTVTALSSAGALATDRAKAEIILNALGTDSTQLTSYDKTSYNNAEALANMQLGSSCYAAPWILLAEEAGQLSLSDKQRSDMIDLLIKAQGENGLFYSIWANEKYDDVDTTGTALAALARFKDDNAVKAFCDKALEGLSSAQGENGSYGNINSDAMVIIGLAAMGINPSSDERFVKNGCSLADAVMLYVNDAGNGFTTTYISGSSGDKARALATEQGFRALVTLEQLSDCSAFNVYTMKSEGGQNAPVKAELKPFEATEKTDEKTDESAGESGESGGTSGGSAEAEITVKAEVIAADSEEWLSESVTVEKGATAADVLKKALAKAGMSANGIDSGYIKSVTKDGKTLAEFDKGANSGWMYKINDTAPQKGITDCTVKSGDTVTLYYMADYTKDSSSRKWSRGGSSSAGASETKTDKEETAAESKAEIPFKDVKADMWFCEYVTAAYQSGLMKGVSETEFAPEDNLTRAALVTLLYRMENEPQTELSGLSDAESGAWYEKAVGWAYKNGIVNGIKNGDGEYYFAPNDDVTREQAAAILYRYARYKGLDVSAAENTDISSFDDSESVSEYAASAFRYAVGVKLISGKTEKTLNPGDKTTRAEAAALLSRLAQIIK